MGIRGWVVFVAVGAAGDAHVIRHWVQRPASGAPVRVRRRADVSSMAELKAHPAYLVTRLIYAATVFSPVIMDVMGDSETRECEEGGGRFAHHPGVNDFSVW